MSIHYLFGRDEDEDYETNDVPWIFERLGNDLLLWRELSDKQHEAWYRLQEHVETVLNDQAVA